MSRFPPDVGRPPTKVVFDGVEPGSDAARQLLMRYQAEINRFHYRAKVTSELGASLGRDPASYAQQALPGDDGRMRFSQIGGQETIHIRLNPKVIEGLEETMPEEDRPTQPILAVDVIFDTKTYMTTEIWYGGGGEFNIFFHGKHFDWSRFFIVGLMRAPESDNPKSVINAPPNFFGPSGEPDRNMFSTVAGYARPIEDAPSDATMEAVDMEKTPPAPPPPEIGNPGPGPGLQNLTAENRSGAGFGVRPEFPGETVVLDVYVASVNSILIGDFRPDPLPGADACDIEFMTDVSFKIRVREYLNGDDPRYSYDVATPLGPDGWQETYNVPEEPSPVHSYGLRYGNDGGSKFGRLLVDRNWVYDGSDPSNPDAEGMGKVLDETSVVSRSVSGPVGGARPSNGSPWYNFEWWNDDISSMTKVAQIKWSPLPDSRKGHGTAEIELA